MKTNIQKLGKILLLALMSIFVISCSRDAEDVPEPKNELEEKGHDNWTKVEIIVREGHLHGASFHGNPLLVDVDENDDVVFLPKEQIIIFEQNEKGEVVKKRKDLNAREKGRDGNGKKIYETFYVDRDPNHPIEVQSGLEYDVHGEPAAARYSMEIIYYNGNERINYQFVSPEQIQYHQHFFTAKEYIELETNKIVTNGNRFLGDELFKYTYRDTNPEDRMVETSKQAGAKLSNNPVGLKGYFYFAKSEVKFDMNINLAHLYVSKYIDGKPVPANNPPLSLLSKGTTDFNVNIPFVVVGYNGDDQDSYMESLSRYYKIAVEAIEEYMWGDYVGSAESSNFWL